MHILSVSYFLRTYMSCLYPLNTYRVLLELLRVGGWGWWRSLHVRTCSKLRNCCVALAHMWDSPEPLRCSCTHVRCYARRGVWDWDNDVPCMWHVRCYATNGVGWGGMMMMMMSLALQTCRALALHRQKAASGLLSPSECFQKPVRKA